VVTQRPPELPAHLLKQYPVWRVHKYNGIDMKPVPVAYWNPVVPVAVPETTTPAPVRFPFLNKLVNPLFGSAAPVVAPVVPPPFVYPPVPEEAITTTTTQEPATAVDLLLLAKLIGVTDPRTLPTLEEAGNLLGTTTERETLEAIKELIQTKDGLDLIRSYIRNNPRTSPDIESRQFIVDGSEPEPLPQTWLSTSGIPSGLDRATKDLELAHTIASNTEAPGFLGKLKGLRRFFSFASAKEIPIPTTPASSLIIKTVPEQQVETFALPTIPALAVPNLGMQGLPNLPQIPKIYLPKYLPSNNGKYTYVKYPPTSFDPVPQFTQKHEAQHNVLTQYQMPANTEVFSFTDTDGSLGVADYNNQLRRSGVVPVRNAEEFYAEGKVFKADSEAMDLFIQTPETPKAALVYGQAAEVPVKV
jgi:hypothetical protein